MLYNFVDFPAKFQVHQMLVCFTCGILPAVFISVSSTTFTYVIGKIGSKFLPALPRYISACLNVH